MIQGGGNLFSLWQLQEEYSVPCSVLSLLSYFPYHPTVSFALLQAL
jgi:hypothetical protein